MENTLQQLHSRAPRFYYRSHDDEEIAIHYEKLLQNGMGHTTKTQIFTDTRARKMVHRNIEGPARKANGIQDRNDQI